MRFVKFIAKSILVIFALVGAFVVLGILAIGLAWRSLPGMTAATPPAATVLTFDLADGLTEAAPDNPLSFAGFDKSVTMRDAVRAIEAAAKDSRVKVLLLHLGSGDLDLAHAQELGDAVADFRKSGKFAIAFAESFGEGGNSGSHYLLATSANEIWLQPSGDLQLVGASLQSPFFRDRKSTRLNSSHSQISYAVFCLKKKKPAATSEERSQWISCKEGPTVK